MKKIHLLLLFFSMLALSGCGISFKKDTWQGTYYPDGCLTCESEYVYSPTCESFEACKTWALNKKSDPEDKVTCNKNCKSPRESGIQTCEEVVRNWDPGLGGSATFENYKD